MPSGHGGAGNPYRAADVVGTREVREGDSGVLLALQHGKRKAAARAHDRFGAPTLESAGGKLIAERAVEGLAQIEIGRLPKSKLGDAPRPAHSSDASLESLSIECDQVYDAEACHPLANCRRYWNWSA